MPSRSYAQIDISLKASKKMRGLSSHKARWAYICAHLSDHCTYTGLFRYPQHIWAHDAQLDLSELQDAIVEMVRAGLIDYDEEESFVRIVGWFRKRNGPDNPNGVDAVIKDFSAFDDVDPVMFCKAVSELATSAVRRSLRWNDEKPGRSQLYNSLKQFLPEVFQDYGEDFLRILRDEIQAAPEVVGTEIKAIFPPISVCTESPQGNGSVTVGVTVPEHETRRDEDETKTKQNKNENKTAEISAFEDRQANGPASVSELLRNGARPKVATLNSKLVKQARSGS